MESRSVVELQGQAAGRDVFILGGGPSLRGRDLWEPEEIETLRKVGRWDEGAETIRGGTVSEPEKAWLRGQYTIGVNLPPDWICPTLVVFGDLLRTGHDGERYCAALIRRLRFWRRWGPTRVVGRKDSLAQIDGRRREDGRWKPDYEYQSCCTKTAQEGWRAEQLPISLNTITAALALGFLLGAGRMIVLGLELDCGLHHYPNSLRRSPRQHFNAFLIGNQVDWIMGPIRKRGIEVVNACADSKLDRLGPRRDMHDVLGELMGRKEAAA